MRIAVVGLGLIGGSIALGLAGRHQVRGYDLDEGTRRAARSRGLDVADAMADVLPADAVVVATPLAAIVPTLEELVPRCGEAILIEVGSLKSAVAAFAERAPQSSRIVGLHPMAGSTASGLGAADPAIFQGRRFIVVPTARSDERATAIANDLARELGGSITLCSPELHDRAIAVVSALPLATAVALARIVGEVVPLPLDAVAGPGIRDATRLASTPTDLALALLRAPGLAEHLASLREALTDIEDALGDDATLRALLDGSSARRPT